MKIVVSSSGHDLNAPVSPIFGRCSTYIFVDTDTMAFEAVSNPAVSAAGGAGVQAAQFVVQRGVQAIVTGNVGPNAYGVLRSAGVPVYLYGSTGTIKDAVEDLKQDKLQLVGGANVPGHFGTRGRGMGRGGGRRV